MSNTVSSKPDMKLFWACFIALVATSFVFGIRANLMSSIADDLKLTGQEKGTIFGVGLWPFALSILVFSFVIDRVGYKAVAIFAIICHVVSLVLTVTAKDYRMLFIGTFLVAIANGTVECFINPVVATVFSKEKSKWLNILHAGWPAGMALGGATAMLLKNFDWHIVYGLCFIPVIVYALLVLPQKFPVNERVAAGVSFRDMLKEVGAVGFFIIGALFAAGVIQMASALGDPNQAAAGDNSAFLIRTSLIAGVVSAVLGGLYTRSLGNWLFIVVLLTMGPLATTELGTDSWMETLLREDLPLLAGWVFVLVSVIMTILRFYAGPIVHRFSPIGLLVISAGAAIVGLLLLSTAGGYALILMAVIYGIGKTFLWSTTLGLVSEQFPRGGALTLNGVSAVGVLGMGILGAPLMGFMLDKGVDADLKERNPALHQKVAGNPKPTMFGESPSRKEVKTAEAAISAGPQGSANEAIVTPEEKAAVDDVVRSQNKAAFARQAILPAFMLLCYLGMWLYFKSKGGYKPKAIGHGEEGEPGF